MTDNSKKVEQPQKLPSGDTIDFRAEVRNIHPSAYLTKNGNYYYVGWSENEGWDTEEAAWKRAYELLIGSEEKRHSALVVELTKAVASSPAFLVQTEGLEGTNNSRTFGSNTPEEVVDYAEALAAELEKRGHAQ